MKNKVKIVEFNRRSYGQTVETVQTTLADLLDEGYSIASQSESNGLVTYTLTMREIDMTFAVDNRVPAVALLAGGHDDRRNQSNFH